MKKRIISLILVVVMSVLALASCAYSYADDDMTQYATFDKAAFAAAIKELDIEDSDFTEDKDTRTKKVIDKILTTLAGKADTTDHKTEGTPAANDIFYYCYYVTAVIDEVEYIFMTENMKVEEANKMDSFQLGLNFYDDELTEKIVAALKDFTFEEGKVYEQLTGKDAEVKNGTVVYISYERKYDNTKDDGTVVSVTETASAHRVVLDENNPFHKLLIDKKPTVGTTVTGSIEVKEEDYKDNALYNETRGTYSKIKVEWVESGAEQAVIVDTTYDKATNKPTTIYTGSDKNKDLKDVELSYHIYPAYYVTTPELTAENIITEIYGESITESSLATILLGDAYTDAEDHDAAHKLLEKYSFTKDEKTLDFEEFVTALDNAITEYNSAKKAADSAEDDVEKADEALKTAQESLTKAEADEKAAKEASEAAPEDADLKKKYEDAQAATKAAQAKVTAAEETLKAKKAVYEGEPAKEGEEKTDFGKLGKFDDAKKARATLLTELLTVVGKAEEGEGEDTAKGAAKIIDGYKQNVTYKNLQTTYNNEIKTKIATLVYEKMAEFVTISSYPEKAVDEAYDYLIENYEYMFYENKTVTGSAVSSSSKSNYNKYEGSFERFLVEYAVPEDLDVKVANYPEACAAIKKEAERHVSELVVIYAVSQAYNLVLTDDEFEALAEEDSNYLYYAESYGESAFRAAYQFNKLLDTLLDPTTDEETGDVSYTGEHVTKVNRLTEEEYDAKYPETEEEDKTEEK